MLDKDPKWLAGLFDGCGFLNTHNDLQPHIMITLRSRRRDHFDHLTDHGAFFSEQGLAGGKWFILEVTKQEDVAYFLQAITEFSPVNQSLARAGLFLLEQEKLYPDAKAVLTGRAISNKLKEVNTNEFPL